VQETNAWVGGLDYTEFFLLCTCTDNL